jgi:molybdopterin/thiamine biosynthesis adenylyltransferase
MTGAVTDHEAFYAELVERNRGLIDERSQASLRATRFVIAGCGSTGGACVMPLLRSGAERFVLMDPGSYELNNLNRQDAGLDDLGRNKAAVASRRALAVNPFASVEVIEEGVRAETIASVLAPGDLVVDAVDVTSDEGVRAKYALHQAACGLGLIVVTAYDIGTTQFIEVFDYRRVREPFRGRVRPPLTSHRVLKSLVPPTALPREIFAELRARRADPNRPFPQLAMTSTLLGSLIVPYALRLLNGEPVQRAVRVDLLDVLRPSPRRWSERARRMVGLVRLWWDLRG